MKYAIGFIATTNSAVRQLGFDYKVAVGKIEFYIKNADDLHDDSIGKAVVVQYEPADQFCEVIPEENVQQALAYYAQHYTALVRSL